MKQETRNAAGIVGTVIGIGLGVTAEIVVGAALDAVVPGAGTAFGKAVNTVGKFGAGVAVGYGAMRYAQDMAEDICDVIETVEEKIEESKAKTPIEKVKVKKDKALRKAKKIAEKIA